MTDLTEQWKKGKLPEGYYYVKDGENIIAEYLDGYFYNNGQPMTSFSGGVDEVLAPVPSYDEWKALNGNMDSVMQTNQALCKKLAQLKELLKEWAQFEIEENPNDFTVMSERMSELANKTKEVLK